MLHTGHLAAGLRWPHVGPPPLPLVEGERAELYLLRLCDSEGLLALRFLPVAPSIDDRLVGDLAELKYIRSWLSGNGPPITR